MIEKRLQDITEDDLTSLISGGVTEGRTIEYKRQLPGNSDGDKKEFLADVSSFANTGGGDLIFGMTENQGVAAQILGLQSGDLDLEIRRLDSIISSGLDPRIRRLEMAPFKQHIIGSPVIARNRESLIGMLLGFLFLCPLSVFASPIQIVVTVSAVGASQSTLPVVGQNTYSCGF